MVIGHCVLERHELEGHHLRVVGGGAPESHSKERSKGDLTVMVGFRGILRNV